MKTVWAFIKWHVSKWSPTQRLWMIASALFGSGIVDYWKDGTIPWQWDIAFGIMCVVFSKWFIWDMVEDSWKKFKQERKDLFTTIKESDNASKSN